MDVSDNALMAQWQGGEYEAFETLYHRHKASLLRYFQRQVSGPVAEELFQDVWLKVINSRDGFRPTATFKTWLYTVAHNRLIDCYRRQQKQPESVPIAEEQLTSGTNPSNQSSTLQELQHLLVLIKKLPTDQRNVFLLREEAGFTLPEIAELTGHSLEATKSKLRYAIKKLKAGMEVHCHV